MATEIQNIKSSFRNMINCISVADKNTLKFKRKLSCANKYLKVIWQKTLMQQTRVPDIPTEKQQTLVPHSVFKCEAHSLCISAW